MADNPQHLRLPPIPAGDAVSLPFDGTLDPSAWAITLTVARDDGGGSVTVSTPTVTTATVSAGTYRITCPLTAAQTTTLLDGSAAPVPCTITLARTDAGSETKVAGGTVVVWPRGG